MTCRRVAMVPARLGSKRVPRKNLRLLGGKPLVQWAVEAAKSSGLFDAIYINSEAPELEHLARDLGVEFYQRPAPLALDTATSEDFVLDFLRNVDCDVLAQLLPTSPFLSICDIANALRAAETFETVIAARRIQAECLYAGRGINFQPSSRMRMSQELTPVSAVCNGIFVWHKQTFLNSQRHYGAATFGPAGSVAYVCLEGDSALDIDTEDDFRMAEAIVARRVAPRATPRYWSPTYVAERDHDKAVRDDGVGRILDATYNGDDFFVSLGGVLGSCETGAAVIVDTPSSRMTVITQLPGESNRRHYHPDLDEWWLVLGGKLEFTIGDKTRVANAWDVVLCPRGVWHQITVVGEHPGIRVAVSRGGAAHVYHD